jgi:hypothetical protein
MAVVLEIIDLVVCRKIHGCGCVADDPAPRKSGKEEDGFNPADPTIQKIMRGLLAELIDLLSKDYELNIIDSANNSVSYIRVPKTSSN